MKWVLIVLLAAGVAAGIDRLLLWAEDQGWVFYRRRKASSTSVSNAMLELHALFEPEKHHVVVERRAMELDEFEVGDPPDRDPDPRGGAEMGPDPDRNPA